LNLHETYPINCMYSFADVASILQNPILCSDYAAMICLHL
jgi:hypothetical protein